MHVTDDDDDDGININTIENSNTTDVVDSTYSDPAFDKLFNNWLEFDSELRTFEQKHKEYVHQMDQIEKLKGEYAITLSKYQKKFGQLKKEITDLKKSPIYAGKYLFIESNHHIDQIYLTVSSCLDKKAESDDPDRNFLKPKAVHFKESLTASHTPRGSHHEFEQIPSSLPPPERMKTLIDRVEMNSNFLKHVADTIPRKDSYLRVILGGVNVSILNKSEKLKYKQEYEKFKFIITCISLISSILIWSLTSRLRAFDALFHFLLVWYYCTLTIRESILVVNGSNIHRKFILFFVCQNDMFDYLQLGGELTISSQLLQLAFC